MGRFKSKWSRKAEQALKVLRELVEEEGWSSACEVFSEAVADPMREAWTEGMKETTGYCCIHRVLGKQCTLGSSSMEGRHYCNPPGGDHPSLWIKDGKPHVFLSQPYLLTLDIMRDTVRFCDHHNLDVTVRNGSWYYPTGTLLIEYKEGDRVPRSGQAARKE